jgi:hypothetical protein
MSTAVATLHIPVAMTGVDAEGIAYRMDTVPLMVKKVMDSIQPDDAELLRRILKAIQEENAQQTATQASEIDAQSTIIPVDDDRRPHL